MRLEQTEGRKVDEHSRESARKAARAVDVADDTAGRTLSA